MLNMLKASRSWEIMMKQSRWILQRAMRLKGLLARKMLMHLAAGERTTTATKKSLPKMWHSALRHCHQPMDRAP